MMRAPFKALHHEVSPKCCDDHVSKYRRSDELVPDVCAEQSDRVHDDQHADVENDCLLEDVFHVRISINVGEHH